MNNNLIKTLAAATVAMSHNLQTPNKDKETLVINNRLKDDFSAMNAIMNLVGGYGGFPFSIRGEEMPFVLPEELNTDELKSANTKIAAAKLEEEKLKIQKAQEKREKKQSKITK